MWLYLIVSLTAFAGFLIGRRSERPAGRIAAGVCFAVLLLSTVFGLMRSEDRDFAARERDYYASQAARIGVALKERNASGRVTLLVFEELKETEEVEEFRRVLARFGECGDIAIRTVALAHPAALTGAGRLDAGEFRRVLEEAADDAVVSLVGLPRDLRGVRELRRGRAERMPLIAVCDDPVPPRVLKENLIDAGVLPKRNAFFSPEPVSDYLKAFDERYYYAKAY